MGRANNLPIAAYCFIAFCFVFGLAMSVVVGLLLPPFAFLMITYPVAMLVILALFVLRVMITNMLFERVRVFVGRRLPFNVPFPERKMRGQPSGKDRAFQTALYLGIISGLIWQVAKDGLLGMVLLAPNN